MRIRKRLLVSLAAFGMVCATDLRAAPPSTMPTVDSLPELKELPNPLVRSDGSQVSTLQQWSQRREEMKAILEHYLLGHAPPPPGNVTEEVIESKSVRDGNVDFELVNVSFGEGGKHTFELAVYKPAGTKARLPVIVHISFAPTPGTRRPTYPVSMSWANTTRPSTQRVTKQAAMESQRTAEAGVEPFADPLSRGYAVATFHYQQFGLDQPAYEHSGFFDDYPDYDWRDLRAWAWGMSRVVDYLETQDWADKKQLVAVGHSRLGKTALIAGAFDERFAVVAPNGSGCAGTGAFRVNGRRRGGKEGLEELTTNFPHWCSPELKTFSGKVEKLPFDQNWLIGLVAPRALIANDALDDPFANGKALKASFDAAKPVFQFLDVPENLGVHFRPGGHALGEADWKVILDFADTRMRGKKSDKAFSTFPAYELLN